MTATEHRPGAPVQHPLHRGWLAALLPAGFVLGVVSAFLHESSLTIGSVSLPLASILVLATLIVTVRALSLNMGTRLAGAIFFLGWLLATGLMAVPNPSGDVIFSADAWSLGYLMAGCVLGAGAASWPLFLRIEPPAEPSGDESE